MPNDNPNRQFRICAVCQRVLNRHVHPLLGEHWEHTLQEELDTTSRHDPVPIVMPADYGQGRCDFCNTDWPRYEVPAEDFTMRANYRSRGNWAACAACADLVRTGEWEQLLQQRVVALHAQRDRPMNRTQVREVRKLYRTLARHITGDPIPLNSREKSP